MDMNCGKCNLICRDVEVRCGGYCEKNYHMKCVGLSKYECDALFKYKNLRYICDGCMNFIKLTNENYKSLFNLVKQSETKMAEEINKTNKLMEQQVKVAKAEIVREIKRAQTNTGDDTYASKLKSANSVPVILKPKNQQTSELTEKEVKEKIKPSDLNMTVKRIAKRNDGIIAISCDNVSERNALSDKIKEKMGNEYEVQAPRMRNPKILVTGMSEELEKSVIVRAIKNQNDINDVNLQCIKVYKSNKNPQIFNAIIETDGEGYNKIMGKKKIYVEWDRCPVYEICNVLRCFKCWGFNHTAKYCKNDGQICAKCSQTGHTYRECRNSSKCINCVKAKERLRLADIDIGHDSRSEDCPVLIRRRKMETERIAY
ncbi:uncharacterized protein LOC142230218 [Haematobia irritans]|uniref:uncharacterized protein LOC142230218 n=1 Tax=Haematobia irritans TaxID=7368 RepID=UPI003F50B199